MTINKKAPSIRKAVGVVEKYEKKQEPTEVTEPEKTPARKRRRLSKAFSRPLDKKIRRLKLVRDSFSFPEADYLRLVELKKNLLAEGIKVKKSELLLAGLALLCALGNEELKSLLIDTPVPEQSLPSKE